MYHVQTEDRGPSHPVSRYGCVSWPGRVVYKRSTSYEKFARGVGSGNPGTEAARAPGAATSRSDCRTRGRNPAVSSEGESRLRPRRMPRAEEGLDLRLTNPKSWFAAGNVTFEIELREKNSKRGIGDADVQACLEHEKHRIPCAEVRTDANGCATLKFPMPANVAEGSSLVVRATDGSRYGELRFRLKSKSRDKTPAPVAQ